MKYQELIDYGKRVFNFHPDAEFKSIEQVLFEGRKSCSRSEYYDRAAALIAEKMAEFIDKQEAI